VYLAWSCVILITDSLVKHSDLWPVFKSRHIQYNRTVYICMYYSRWRPALGPIQSPVQWVMRFFPGLKQTGRKVNHSYLVLRFGVSGKILLLPSQALMACIGTILTFCILRTVYVVYMYVCMYVCMCVCVCVCVCRWVYLQCSHTSASYSRILKFWVVWNYLKTF